jgi:glycosyltransferase involved in cell wall biosynthesis
VGDVKNRKVRVSYILNVKNRVDFIKTFFESYKKIYNPNDELVVVDGDSTDGTKEVIESNLRMIDKYVSEPDLSGSHALNKGILMSSGKYIKQFPVDDIIHNLDKPVYYMEQNPDIDMLVLGGVKKDMRGNQVISAPDSYGEKPQDVFEYGACGTGFLIRKSSLAKIGLFTPEDVNADREFACRAIANGKVRFFQGNFYWHGIYDSSTSYKGMEQWHDKNLELIKQYCSPEYYKKYMEVVENVKL